MTQQEIVRNIIGDHVLMIAALKAENAQLQAQLQAQKKDIPENVVGEIDGEQLKSLNRDWRQE
jgi:hypothetical protein